MKSRVLRAIVVVAALIAVVSCTAQKEPRTAPAPSEPAATVVTTGDGPLGQYLTTVDGYALYMFTKDTGTVSACTANCLNEWPPFTVNGELSATGQARGDLLDSEPNVQGDNQVSYNGHLLYRYFRDEKPGEINGQRLGDTWFLVSPEGEQIKEEQPHPTPTN